MIDLADHIAGFRVEDYLPYRLRWLYLDDPDRQEFADEFDLRETNPDAVLKEAQLLSRILRPTDADGFVIELGGLGVYEECRTTAA